MKTTRFITLLVFVLIISHVSSQCRFIERGNFPAHSTQTKRPAIEGDSIFKARTTVALNLLENKSVEGWRVVSTYVGKIKQFHRSGMNVYANPPTFEVGKETYMASATWYASAIAHDAWHAKLYFDHKKKYSTVPDDIWTGQNAEMQCLDFQIKVLEQIGAPKSEIDYAKSLKGTNWWDKERTW